ncbi:MAG: U32 family peptidase [Acutalibacteraceae bacterium]
MKTVDKKCVPELLSPAGDAERLDAALLYGADAVYLAGTAFGMRSACRNFDKDGLNEAVKKAHLHGAKVYVTCNTLPRNTELPALPSFLEQVEEAGADALIVADIGLIPLVKRYAPHTALHISTQLGVLNYATASMLYDMGASRVVLARELSLEEIADIRAHTNRELELEAFVHGSMCMAVSGRCMFSYYLAGRDASRGDCSQPCRWKYQFAEPHRADRVMTGVEDGQTTYLFNADDLNMIGHIPALLQAGISSFKIEGRAKASYYVAAVTNAYRHAIDCVLSSSDPSKAVLPSWILDEMNKVSHRPYSTGFYFGQPTQNNAFGGYIRSCEVAAVVVGYENGRLLLRQRNRFFKGETLDVLTPHEEPFLMTATAIYDEEGTEIDCAPHPDMPISVPFDRPLSVGSFLRRERKEDTVTA